MTQESTHKIEISEKLKSILLEFESESQVARLLLSKEVTEFVEDAVNYISISEQDKSKISYLSPDRTQKIRNIINTDYTTEQISAHVDHQIWNSSTRFHTRPGAFIGKIFKNISPREVEIFSNLYRSNVSKPRFELKVVSGSAIRKYYHYETYAGEGSRGTLGNSCMKHDSCQKFLDIYVDNVDILSMLIMLDDDGMLMGRALLWNYESYKIMDRIYTTADEELPFYFKKWAVENGYLYKSEQNFCNTLYFESPSSKKQILKLDFKLSPSSHRQFPYLDTFKWIDLKNNTLHNYIPIDAKEIGSEGFLEKADNIKTLIGSDGSKLEWDYMVLDEINTGSGFMHRYKGECARILYLNIWTHQQNTNYSEINNQWILKEDAVYDDDLRDWIFKQEKGELNNSSLIEERKKAFFEIRERKKREKEADKAFVLANIHNYPDIQTAVNDLGGIDGAIESSLWGQIVRAVRTNPNPRTESVRALSEQVSEMNVVIEPFRSPFVMDYFNDLDLVIENTPGDEDVQLQEEPVSLEGSESEA